MKLAKQSFHFINEHFLSANLENGMKLIFIPKKGFKKTTCMLTVGFGSIDATFTLETDKFFSYPEGIAHFLEHKMFELENEQDAAILFTNLGADANAFTSFNRTSYFFSTTQSISDALALLQTFVTSTHFEIESIEKEKSIISQEIDMYQDDPDYRLYQGILENLYPNTVLSKDIAGSKDSINRITVEDLKENHHLFYTPRNMTLLVIGDIDENVLYQEIVALQKKLASKDNLPPKRNSLNLQPVIKTKSIQMEVALPKLAVAYRGQLKPDQSLLKQKVALHLLLSMLLGWTSQTYQEWYESGQIDDSFDIEVEVNPSFQFVMFSSDTLEPIALSTKIRQLLNNRNKAKDISENHLQLVKKEMYGDFIKSLDDIEHLANQFMEHLTKSETYFNIPEILKKLTLPEILEIGNSFFETADTTDFTIFPK